MPNGFAFLEASLPPKLRDLVRDGVPDTEDRSAEFHHAIRLPAIAPAEVELQSGEPERRML
jgi:hypothetical protein